MKKMEVFWLDFCFVGGLLWISINSQSCTWGLLWNWSKLKFWSRGATLDREGGYFGGGLLWIDPHWRSKRYLFGNSWLRFYSQKYCRYLKKIYYALSISPVLLHQIAIICRHTAIAVISCSFIFILLFQRIKTVQQCIPLDNFFFT